MYGTTIRNYNTTQGVRVEAEEENFFNRNNTTDMQETRYVKIEETPVKVHTDTTKPARENKATDTVSRKEFPIASVILTIIITMLLLLVTTGVISW